MDFSNWPKEKQKLKDEIFQELRHQRDKKTDSHLTGIITINPQSFNAAGDTVIFGPIPFNTSFKGRPVPVFGNIMVDESETFIVMPVVKSWSTTQGTVDGFTLELYALMDPPNGLLKHKIGWIVQGSASHYKAEARGHAWTSSYNQDTAVHLTGTLGAEQSTTDLIVDGSGVTI